MTRRDLLTMAAAAAASFGLAVAAFTPRYLDAKDDAVRLAAKIDTPRLNAKGAEVFISAKPDSFKPGAPASFELVAMNTKEESVTVTVDLQLMHSRPASPMARVIPAPKAIWTQSHTFELRPGETTRVPMQIESPLPAAGSFHITMASEKQSVVGTRFNFGGSEVGMLPASGANRVR